MKTKRLVSALLCIVMVFGLLATVALPTMAASTPLVSDLTLEGIPVLNKGVKLEKPTVAANSSLKTVEIESVIVPIMSQTYYDGQTLPNSIQGTTLGLTLRIKPSVGFYFSTISGVPETQVIWNGESLTGTVVNGVLVVSTTYTLGEYKSITIRDLEAPKHGRPVDTTATAECPVAGVQYIMFNRALEGPFDKGNELMVRVNLDVPDGYSINSTKTKITWNGQTPDVIVRPEGGDYAGMVCPGFYHTVTADSDQYIKNVNLLVDVPYVGATPDTNVLADGGVKDTTSITWTPADKKFKDGVSYTAKIRLAAEDDRLFPDNFETTGKVTVNGRPATITREWVSMGAKGTYQYFASYTFGKPEKDELVNPFTDVKEKDYFFIPVLWAVENGVTTGTSATTFSPNAPCTRAQAVTFLWRAAGQPAAKGKKNPFTDVKAKDYFYDAVLWAVENNVTTGTAADKFSPNDPCTRGQIVTFLWRAQGTQKVTSANPFKDVKATDYYYNAVLWAVKNNVTTGTAADKFSPADTCTRGQIVTFLYRAINK